MLAELERREDARISKQLEQFLAGSDDLVSSLNEVVRAVVAAERRLGSQRDRAEFIEKYVASTRRSLEKR